MMNKLCLTGLALLATSTAFAQTAITTNYTSPVTLTTSNGCRISGVTTTTYDGSGTITTNGTDSCASPGGGGQGVASATLAISATTYSLGSNAAAPTISITNNTAAATIVCTLTPPAGFTVTPTSITNTGTFTLSTPTTAGTYSFTPSCSTSTSGYTSVSVTPATVSLTVSNTPPPPPPGCSPTTLSSTINGKTLQRQCTGTMQVDPGPIANYTGALTDLGTVLGNKSFPNYSYTGYTPVFTINAGYYIALQFTPSTTGTVQLVANTSYADGGWISLSTEPGAFVSGAPGTICSLARGGSNSLYFGTAVSYCNVQVGQTYYINITDTDTLGNFLCYGGRANTCTTSLVGYSLYTSP